MTPTLAPRAQARHDEVPGDGITLAATTYDGPSADAPTVVLLHGIGGGAATWWPIVDDLARLFRLVALDLRGHGASDKPETGYLLPNYAADLARALDALGIDHPLLLGHSLGGLVAFTWANQFPERAAGIALEDSPLRGGSDHLPAFDGWIALNRMSAADAAAYYRREYPTWSADECQRRAEAITSVAPGVFSELRATNVGPGLVDRIPNFATIRSPALMVKGDLNAGGMVHDEDAERFAATLPNAQVHWIAGGSHSLHRDFTRPFLDAVIPFLRACANQKQDNRD